MDKQTIACKYCGEEILSVAIKCKHCESILIEKTKLLCPGCNKDIPKSTKLCPNCNIDIEKILKNCKNCDTLYFLGAIKCSKCEYPLITQELYDAKKLYEKCSKWEVNDYLLQSYQALEKIENLSELVKQYRSELNWIYSLIQDIVFNRIVIESFIYQVIKTEKYHGIKTEYSSYIKSFKTFLIEKMNFMKESNIVKYVDLYSIQNNFFNQYFFTNKNPSFEQKTNQKKHFIDTINKIDNALGKRLEPTITHYSPENKMLSKSLGFIIAIVAIVPLFLLGNILFNMDKSAEILTDFFQASEQSSNRTISFLVIIGVFIIGFFVNFPNYKKRKKQKKLILLNIRKKLKQLEVLSEKEILNKKK